MRPNDSNEVWIDRLFAKPMTAKEIYGLLSPGQIFENDKKYSIKLYMNLRKPIPSFVYSMKTHGFAVYSGGMELI